VPLSDLTPFEPLQLTEPSETLLLGLSSVSVDFCLILSDATVEPSSVSFASEASSVDALPALGILNIDRIVFATAVRLFFADKAAGDIGGFLNENGDLG
jgi:hypothetical protein